MKMFRGIPAGLLGMLFAAFAGLATAETLETQKIITALTGDFNSDGAQDLVLIAETKPTDPFDMHFFLRDKQQNYLKPVEVVHDQIYGEWIAYDQPGYGNPDPKPQLSALPNGSILLKIPAMPVGRRRTDQTLTLAYREGQFVVAGFAYQFHDYEEDSVTDSDALRSRCDYNLLTGKGRSAEKDKRGRIVEKVVSVPRQIVAFRDWEFSTSVEACGNTE